MKGRWVPHDTRDEIVDYVRRWSDRTELPAKALVGWVGIGASKFHNGKDRYGKANEHNAWVPRDGWLLDGEKQAILDFQREFPLEGYRRLTFMMLDRDIVAVSPTSVYRREPTDHLRQRPAVCGQGVQGIHPALRHDPRANVAVRSAKQRQEGTLVPDLEKRVHPAGNPLVVGGRPAGRRSVR